MLNLINLKEKKIYNFDVFFIVGAGKSRGHYIGPKENSGQSLKKQNPLTKGKELYQTCFKKCRLPLIKMIAGKEHILGCIFYNVLNEDMATVGAPCSLSSIFRLCEQ